MAGPCFQCFLWGVQSCNIFDCLRRSPWHTEEDWVWIGNVCRTLEAQSPGWLEQGAGSQQRLLTFISPSHTWSALADIGFPLCAECLRTRACQERTSLAYLAAALWLPLVTASGMSLPGGWGSCLGSNAAGFALGHICPKNGLAELTEISVPPMFLASLPHLWWCQPKILEVPTERDEFQWRGSPLAKHIGLGFDWPFLNPNCSMLHRRHWEAKRSSWERR